LPPAANPGKTTHLSLPKFHLPAESSGRTTSGRRITSARGPSKTIHAFGFGSLPGEPEEARAYVQRRLRRYVGTIVLLWLLAELVGITGIFALFLPGLERLVSSPSIMTNAAGIAGGALVYLSLRIGKHATWLLHGIDVCFAVAIGGFLAWGMAKSPAGMRLDLLLLIVLSHLLYLRASLVPSSIPKTLFVGAAACAPAFYTVFSLYGEHTESDRAVALARQLEGHVDLGYALLSTGIWVAVILAGTAATSRVLFGLRREVHEASNLGKYHLEECLGEGGMGVVYRASHALLRRPAAIKFLPPDEAGVQLTSRLTHPNVVSVFDYGRTPDGVFYYAMELLDGVTLEELVARDGRQSPGRVIHILRQVVSALVEAHGIGLIHRDIKPSNVLLCERGGIPDFAKVVDFGLVKDLGDVGSELSAASTIVGTPQYLPPEAIRTPEALDARADLYQVGAVAYFLLTGEPVFDGGSVIEVCSHHLHSPVEPPSARIGSPIPDDVEQLVLQCLSKDPADRPSSARELELLLEACGASSPWPISSARAWWEDFHANGRHSRDTNAGIAAAPTQAIALDTDVDAPGRR
jgi:eukaryotic-like serine/threonine-protein kinase